MGKISEVVRSSAIYTILGFLPTAVNFFMVPLLTSYLSKEEYGLLSVATMFQGVITIFINVGMDSAYARFYFDVYKKKKMLHGFFSTVIVSTILFASIVFLFLFFFGDEFLNLFFKNKTFHFSDYGIISFFIAVTTIIFANIQSHFRNEENIKNYAIVSISLLALTVFGVLYGVVYLDEGAYGNLSGRLFALSFVVVVYLFLYFRKRTIIFKKSFLIKMLKYGFPFIPYFLLLLANSSIDQWMIERNFSLLELGAYNFTFQLASLLSVFMYSVFNAISPKIYKLMSNNIDFKNDREINENFRFFHLIVIVALVFAFAVIVPVIKLLISNGNFFTYLPYMSLFFIYWLFHLYYMMFVMPLMYHNKTKILPVILFFSLTVGTIFNFLLIPIWGVVGVLVSSITIKIVSFILTVFFLKKYKVFNSNHYRMNKNHYLSFSVFICLIISLFFTWVIPKYNNLLNMIPMIIFVLLCFVLGRKFFIFQINSFMKKVRNE